ncbi:MAG: hypothetical protein R3F24_06875 [Gammaproteobacteria bacterium]
MSPEEWRQIATQMEQAFAAGNFESGTLTALDRIGGLARQHFPLSAAGDAGNELPDRTVLL